MKITSVNLARATIFLPGGTEITIGRIPIEAATKFLCERFGFLQYPKTLEDWMKPEGAIFAYGRHDGVIVTKMTIYARGVGVETQTNTDDCERIIQDLLSSASDTLKIELAAPISRKVFQSDLTFVSDAALNAIHPALNRLADKVGLAVASFMPGLKYEVTVIHLNADEAHLKYAPGAFRIERR